MVGFFLWFFLLATEPGASTHGGTERAGGAHDVRARRARLGAATTLDDPIAAPLRDDERERYAYPQLRVVGPGFYWKAPWQRAHKVSIATRTISVALDPEFPGANAGGQILDAVTQDQLNIGLTGQLRYGVSERNLYAYLFGVKNSSRKHVMGYFTSDPARPCIATTSGWPPPAAGADAGGADPAQAISINDLRKHLSNLNERMNVEGARRRPRGTGSCSTPPSSPASTPPARSRPPSRQSTRRTTRSRARSASLRRQRIRRSSCPVARSRDRDAQRAGRGRTFAHPRRPAHPALEVGSGRPLGAYLRNARLVLLRKTRQLVLTREMEEGR